MLKELFNKYGCDKAKKHLYHEVYQAEFERIKDDPINILEIGVFKGHSVQAWLDYFPNATIYGIDVFTRVQPEQIEVLNDPRVKWLRADSTVPDVVNKIKSAWPRIRFDIVIDDGLHTPRANAETLQNIFPLIKKTGAYYVEDVWPIDMMNNREMQHPWIMRYPNRYNILEMNYFLSQLDDKKVTRFDQRSKSKEPDSYIIKVENASV